MKPVIVSMGCPSGVGAEVILGALKGRALPPVLVVGARSVLVRAAKALALSEQRVTKMLPFDPSRETFRGVRILDVTEAKLSARDSSWGRPSKQGGYAQLLYIERAYALARDKGWPMATAPVSKEAIVRSEIPRLRKFRGHTEWLEELDDAKYSVMCFSCKRLTTSLCTTHIAVRQISKSLSSTMVVRSVVELVDLLLRRGCSKPSIVVCSLNPHAGEGELLGDEERTAIAPGIKMAQQFVGKKAKITGPLGAETAYRKGAQGDFDGVVAMYHDQATIPMKLLDFGGSVNITQGLSIVRTSVDHGTAYDIAGRGVVDPRGMKAAIMMASQLGRAARAIEHSKW